MTMKSYPQLKLVRWSMQTGTESRTAMISGSIKVIGAGFAAFFVVGGGVLGTTYIALVYLLPRPSQWAELELNVSGMLGVLLAVAVGAGAAGYMVARTAHCAPFRHSALLAILLAAMHFVCLYREFGTFWDMFADLSWTPIPMLNKFIGAIASLFIYSPVIVLGTLIGLRKHRGRMERRRPR